MNDENFFKKAAAHGEEPPLTPQNEHQRSGLRFARRVRLPRAVGLAGMFLPIASTLVSHPPPGWWWLVLVGWAFVWPHLAWQIASRAVDPLSREIYNLKTDAVLAGMWVGVMGVNVLPSTAMLMIMCLNLMGAGGPRLFVAGLVLMVVSCLVTLEATTFRTVGLLHQEWWMRPDDPADADEKESGKWLAAAATSRLRMGSMMSNVIAVCDREADIHAYLQQRLRQALV